jgi:hypothetical protein
MSYLMQVPCQFKKSFYYNKIWDFAVFPVARQGVLAAPQSVSPGNSGRVVNTSLTNGAHWLTHKVFQ